MGFKIDFSECENKMYLGESEEEEIEVVYTKHGKERSKVRDGEKVNIPKSKIEKLIDKTKDKILKFSEKYDTFVIRGKEKLHVVGELIEEGEEFIFKVITVMLKQGFKPKPQDKLIKAGVVMSNKIINKILKEVAKKKELNKQNYLKEIEGIGRIKDIEGFDRVVELLSKGLPDSVGELVSKRLSDALRQFIKDIEKIADKLDIKIFEFAMNSKGRDDLINHEIYIGTEIKDKEQAEDDLESFIKKVDKLDQVKKASILKTKKNHGVYAIRVYINVLELLKKYD